MSKIGEKALYLQSKPYAKTCLTSDGYFYAPILLLLAFRVQIYKLKMKHGLIPFIF